MAHHYPDVPNLGDVTKVDWASVPHIDILTGGSPCQDLSHAGKRAGMTAGTRSNLWVQMREAIAVLRPRLVVWENVRGALSASADSDLEPCPGCMGDPDDGAVLRALGRVLGDLADLGYDARWYGLRAADVGAPHGRFRVFVFAWPADTAGHPWRLGHGNGGAAADTERGGWERGASFAIREAVERAAIAYPSNRSQSPGAAVRPSLAGLADADWWGDYAPTIARWERVIGRPAPEPTKPGKKGGRRLAPVFVEWMMGLPQGHVTDVPNLADNAMLRALGNGVVPQQAAAAARALATGLAGES